jgi:hypothetical protein
MIRSNTNMIAKSSRTASGGRGAVAALLTLIAALVAVTVGAGTAQAASFGSDLNKNVQPSNAGTAHDCESPGKCTWVMGEAYGNPGGEESPKSGYLKKVKLIAGESGSFKLQIVKTTFDGHTKIKRSGPKVSYQGQEQANWDNDNYRVEKFKTRVRIKQGERLAIKTDKTSTLRCSSGGANTLQHNPPLKKKDGYRVYDDTDGCWMLIEGKVK